MTLVVLSGYNQKTYVAGLQHNEYRILKKTYSNFKVSSDERLTIIRPKYGLLKRINYIDNEFSDEFGNLSSVKDWVPNHLFCQIKWEQLTNKNQNLEPYTLKNITVISENSSKTSSGKIIDLVDVFKKHFVEE